MYKASPSKYRLANARPSKDTLALPSLTKPKGAEAGITAGTRFVAAACGTSSAGHVVIAPWAPSSLDEQEKEPFEIVAHPGGVGDTAWDRFNTSRLYTGGADESVRIWNVDGSDSRRPIDAISLDEGSVLSLNPHPTTGGCLGVGASAGLAIIDVENKRSMFSIRAHTVAAADYSSLSWNRDGSHLILAHDVSRKNNNGVAHVDPRQASSWQNVVMPKDFNVQNVSFCRESQFIAVGQGQFRDPRAAIFDARKLVAPLFTQSLTSLSAGFVLPPVFDYDSNLLLLTTRGSTTLAIFDLTLSTASSMTEVTKWAATSLFQGITQVPKVCCDVLGGEVAHLVQLTTDGIQSCSIVIPRKLREFHDDIFPETAGLTPAQSTTEYASGLNPPPCLVSLNPKVMDWSARGDVSVCSEWTSGMNIIPKKGQSAVASLQASSGKFMMWKPDASAPEETGMNSLTPTEELELLQSSIRSENREKIMEQLKKSIFAHVKGLEPRSLDAYWYGVRRGPSIPGSGNVAIGKDCIIVPWNTGGGSALGVVSLSNPGRVREDINLIRAHGDKISSFEISQINPYFLATGCVDGHVRVWVLPGGDLKKELSQPDKDIICPGRVTCLRWHPAAENVLCAACQSFSGPSCQIWNLVTEQCEIELEGHPDVIVDVCFDFNYGGSRLATVCKDHIVRIFEPRVSTTPFITFECEEGVRETRLLFLQTRDDRLLTIGFGPGSARRFTVWNLDYKSQVATPLASHTIDHGSATLVPHLVPEVNLLFLGGLGDRSIHSFEVADKTGEIQVLATYTSAEPSSALCFFPTSSRNVRAVEIARVLRHFDNKLKPVSMCIPRKRVEYFQDDLFPPAFELKPLFSAAEWFGGANGRQQRRIDLKPNDMEALSNAPPEDVSEAQLKRLENHRMRLGQEKEESGPSLADHVSNFKSLAPSAVNRWDATPIACSEVDEEEWED